MNGYTILGTSAPDRVITVRVRNALALAKGQSNLATVASWVPGAGPDFVVSQAYEAVAQKIGDALAEQHADADVRVIDGASGRTFFQVKPKAPAPSPTAPGVPSQESDVWKFARTYKWGFVGGVGVSGLAALAWHFLRSRSA